MPKRSLDHKTVVLLPLEVMKNKLMEYKAMKIVVEDGKEKMGIHFTPLPA